MPARQLRRGRLWLNDWSCVRLRPDRRNHVWAYDFVLVRTRDGRPVRLLTVIDEYTRECLAIRAGRNIRPVGVIETLAELMISNCAAGQAPGPSLRATARELGIHRNTIRKSDLAESPLETLRA